MDRAGTCSFFAATTGHDATAAAVGQTVAVGYSPSASLAVAGRSPGTALNALNSSMIAVALVVLRADVGLDAATVTRVITAFYLTSRRAPGLRPARRGTGRGPGGNRQSFSLLAVTSNASTSRIWMFCSLAVAARMLFAAC